MDTYMVKPTLNAVLFLKIMMLQAVKERRGPWKGEITQHGFSDLPWSGPTDESSLRFTSFLSSCD